MKKITVMHIITRLNIGGASVHVIQLTAGMNPEKYHSHLVTGLVESNESDMMYLANEMGVTPSVIPSLQRSISLREDSKAMKMLYQTMRDIRPDVVITHTSKAGTLGRIAAIFARVPIILHTYHGNIFNGYYGKGKTRFFVLVERLLARYSDVLIALSPQQKKELEHNHIAPHEKIKIVPLGFNFENVIPTHNSKTALKEELSIASSTPTIGIIGRLTDIKNHQFFFDIADKVLMKNQDVHFIIVGDGELREALEQRAQTLPDHSRIHFVGFQTDLQKVYASLDAVVLTSKNEGTPVALIEAMACGKIVFSTKVGGVEDFVRNGENGFYFEPGDSEGFVDQIIQWLDHPQEYTTISKNARQTALDSFTLSGLLKNMQTVIDEQCRKKGLL